MTEARHKQEAVGSGLRLRNGRVIAQWTTFYNTQPRIPLLAEAYDKRILPQS